MISFFLSIISPAGPSRVLDQGTVSLRPAEPLDKEDVLSADKVGRCRLLGRGFVRIAKGKSFGLFVT